MMHMLRGALLLTLSSLSLLVPAAAGGAEPPTARQLLAEMTEALGGAEAIASVRTLAVEAACSGPGGAFTTQVRSVRGGGTYFRQASRDRVTEIWSRPERTWTLDGGVVVDRGEPVRDFVRNHEFHLLILEVAERFADHRFAAFEDLAGRAVARLEMLDEAGAPASLFLARDSHLPIALELNPEGAAGTLRIVFADWVSYSGVRLFRSFDLHEGPSRSFRYDYASIEINADLDALFEVPADREEELRAIRAILDGDRRAHLETDADLLGSHLAETLVEVSGGGVRERSRAEVVEFFRGRFDGAVFRSWDDDHEPVIRLSDDLRMAWVVRTVSAEREDVRDGRTLTSRYTSAYTATYEKRDGRWLMTSVTSTFLQAE